jgi:hypothetical protein
MANRYPEKPGTANNSRYALPGEMSYRRTFYHGERGDLLAEEIRRLSRSLDFLSSSIRLWVKEFKCETPFYSSHKALAAYIKGRRAKYAELFQRREALRVEYHNHFTACYEVFRHVRDAHNNGKII